MIIKSTLLALLLSACSIPGINHSSTFSTSSSPAPAQAPAEAPVAEAPAPAAVGLPDLDDRAIEPIDGAARWLSQVNSGQIVPGHGTKEEELRNQVLYCTQQVDNLINHQKYPLSTKLPLKNADPLPLGEAEAKICKPLAAAADGWDVRGKQAIAAANDAELEPFRKAGIAGDKLKLVSDLGKELIGPSQAEATPAIVANASVLFSLRHDGFRQWTIVRYAFKGNTQTSVTEKGYADQPGPEQYR
jgi:hypothetical protein